MKNYIEARGEHKPPRSSLLTAVTDDGESGPVKKPVKPVHIYKCSECGTERKVFDHSEAPAFCSYCGSIVVGFDRTEYA